MGSQKSQELLKINGDHDDDGADDLDVIMM